MTNTPTDKPRREWEKQLKRKYGFVGCGLCCGNTIYEHDDHWPDMFQDIRNTLSQLLQECKERIEKKRDEVEDGNGYGIGHKAGMNKAFSIISDIQKEHGL